MGPSEALNLHREEIRRAVEAHQARNARVFGSVWRAADTDASDLDLLVELTSEMTLFDLARIQRLLELLLGVRVDDLTPDALPDKVRIRVLAKAEPV